MIPKTKRLQCPKCLKKFSVRHGEGKDIGDEDYIITCPDCGWKILTSFAFENGKRVIPIKPFKTSRIRKSK